MKIKILILGLFLISSLFSLPQESKKFLKETDIVYVKSGGWLFHLENCGRLKIGNKSILKMTFADALKKGYSPCEVCIPLETQNFVKEKYAAKRATEEPKRAAEKAKQPPIDPAVAAVIEKAERFIEKATELKFLIKFNPTEHEAWVDPVMWVATLYDDKHAYAKLLTQYCDAKYRKQSYLIIRDAYSGVRLAFYDLLTGTLTH
jgi:hypothetical protein